MTQNLDLDVYNMDLRQFLDGFLPLQRRILEILISLSENDTKYIQAKEILYKLNVNEGLMDESEFESCCDELNGHVGPIDSYLPDSVGYSYRTLLQMGQPWRYRYPYFDFHGAIGDLHDDQPAGPEYLQVRLSRFSHVIFPDGEAPLLPLSLLNGTISPEGHVTPSHHLNELWIAMEEVRQNPDITLDQLVEIMPGPDFAFGGVVFGNTASRTLYQEGKGNLILRGSVEILIEGPRTRIAITSLPQGVLAKTILDHIRNLSRSQPDIIGFKDASFQNQIKIIVEATSRWSSSSLVSFLFKETALEQQVPYVLPGGNSLIDVLKRGVSSCSPAWVKKSGGKTDFVPLLKDILKHGGYKSALSDLGDDRRSRILDS